MEFGERKRRRKSQSFKLVTDEGRLLNECKTLQDARLCLGVCLALCASRDDSVNKSDGHDNAHSLCLGFNQQRTANNSNDDEVLHVKKKPSWTSVST